MSGKQSYLSDPHYGYDMVVSVTQESVAATMMQFLDMLELPPFVQAYVYDPNVPPDQDHNTETSFDDLKAAVGFDPFTIPNRTDTSDPRIQKLQGQKFTFAFKAELGLPDFPLATLKETPVIKFNKEGAYVTYNMLSKDFQIISYTPGGYGGGEWVNRSQADSDDPWVFSFQVDLDLREDDIKNHFHNLPPDAQLKIKNLGEDMFSVQQLFLDLNSAGLDTQPKIVGLDPSSVAYVKLTTIFLNEYFAKINTEGGIMLGYTVTSRPFPQEVSLIPTNFNFEISSFKGDDGKATADYDLYTLDYLVMSQGRSLPAPVQFGWNWIDKSEASDYHGTMAINRTTFANFLDGLLSPSLAAVCRKPTASFDVNCIEARFTWGSKSADSPQSYTVVAGPGAEILTCKYTKTASEEDGQYCGVYYNGGSFKVRYTAESMVSLEDNNIEVETTITTWCRISVEGGETKGNFAQYKSVASYQIAVDAYGRLSVTRTGPTLTDLSDSIDPDVWSKLITAGTIQGLVDRITSTTKGWIQDYLRAEASSIADMLNGSSTWVFPGAKTFTFKDIYTSDNQDLVAHVLYVDPTD